MGRPKLTERASTSARTATDADELAHPAAIAKLNDAGDLGKQRVVLAPAHVLARLEGRAALPDDDRTARNQLAAEALTPSRCAFESRPFLELPKPFLCAITNSSDTQPA
jgi:hypothetical protein